jgi:hypothetical protein
MVGNLVKEKIEEIIKELGISKTISYSVARTYGYLKIDGIIFKTDMIELSDKQKSLLTEIDLKENELMDVLNKIEKIRMKMPWKFYLKQKL